MPRPPWRRRLTTDSPRPAGRGRWTGRLRRGRVVARVLRVGQRGSVEPVPGHSARPGRLGRRTAAAPLPPPSAAAVATPLIPAPAGPPAWPSAVPAAFPPGPSAAAELASAIRLLPGPRTTTRRAWFLLVNACTLASLSVGVLAILLAMRGEVRFAAYGLIACVVFDGLDGMLARRLGVASPFGSQMDSLADLCAFGVAAPVVVYASLAGSVPGAAAAVACVLVAGCAAVRLARFNISPQDSRFFSGVPTTMAAAVLAAAVLIDLPLPPAVVLAGVMLLAVAMVSSFPYASLVRLIRLPPWLWLAPLAGALADPRLTFVALVAAYLASGPVLWLHRRRTAAA